MIYDIIDHMDIVQGEMSKLSTEEDVLAFSLNVLNYLESRDKTLNDDIGKALRIFFQTLPNSVAKELWFAALEKKRLKKVLVGCQDDKDFVTFVTSLFT